MSEEHAQSTWRTIWGWIWPIAIGCAVAKALMVWVVSFAEVPTGSMYPTIPNPCYILVDHLATEFAPVTRGEVVLFPWPDNPHRIFVKRIIGLPGETVSVHDGHVYINNKMLNEPYLQQPTLGDYGPYKVPAGHYFMMGDNRRISDDSRFWIHPYVPKSSILGRADYVLWPLGHAKPIH